MTNKVAASTAAGAQCPRSSGMFVELHFAAPYILCCAPSHLSRDADSRHFYSGP
jgi:hypothetical protein